LSMAEATFLPVERRAVVGASWVAVDFSEVRLVRTEEVRDMVGKAVLSGSFVDRPRFCGLRGMSVNFYTDLQLCHKSLRVMVIPFY